MAGCASVGFEALAIAKLNEQLWVAVTALRKIARGEAAGEAGDVKQVAEQAILIVNDMEVYAPFVSSKERAEFV